MNGTPILRSKLRKKDKSGNIRVALKDATPLFLTFPVFLVSQLSLLPVFDGLNVFHHRGTRNIGYAYLIRCYGLVTKKFRYMNI